MPCDSPAAWLAIHHQHPPPQVTAGFRRRGQAGKKRTIVVGTASDATGRSLVPGRGLAEGGGPTAHAESSSSAAAAADAAVQPAVVQPPTAASAAARTARPASQATDGGVTEAPLVSSGGAAAGRLEREVGTVLDVLWSADV